jgi:hypothetical protein
MKTEVVVALIAGTLALAGSILTFYLTKIREDNTKRLEHTMEHYRSQIEEFYGPLFNLVYQIDKLYYVKEDIVNPASGVHDPLSEEQKKEIESFFKNEYFFDLHKEILRILRTKLYLVEGAEIPASFYEYLYHATQEQAQFRLWKENNIDTKHIVGEPFPDQFINDIKFDLRNAMQRYNQTRQIYKRNIFGISFIKLPYSKSNLEKHNNAHAHRAPQP